MVFLKWGRGADARSLLVAIAVFFLTADIAVVAALSCMSYHHHVRQVSAEIRDLAQVVEERVRRTIIGTDFILQRLRDRVEAQGIEAYSGSWYEWTLLADFSKTLPEHAALRVVDASGRLRLTSASRYPPVVMVPDRPYFQAHRAGADMHVGQMIRGRIGGDRIFTVSRRLGGLDGAFLGVVLAAIDVEEFTALYHTLNLRSGGQVALFDDHGASLLWQPPAEGMESRSLAGSPVAAAAAEHGEGTMRTPFPGADGQDQLVAYRRMGDFPLIVTVGIAWDGIMAEWRQEVAGYIAVSALLLTALFALTRQAWAAVRREVEARAALAEANETLEARVTERTAELQTALGDADRANRAKSRFLAAASHDLRQPMQAMHLFHEVLMGKIVDAYQREVATKLGESMKAGDDLLRALLDISTLEAGTVEPRVIRFALGPLLAELADECRPSVAEKGLRMHAIPCGHSVLSDPVLLRRIVSNLLANAVRYTQRGRILLGCRRVGGHVRVEVWDTGPGIAADQLDMIFEEFYQINNPARDRTRGLGLGLSIVHRTAGLLRHPVDVRSRPGFGSVFAVSVPL